MGHVVYQFVAVRAFCSSVPVMLSIFTYRASQLTVCELRQVCPFGLCYMTQI